MMFSTVMRRSISRMKRVQANRMPDHQKRPEQRRMARISTFLAGLAGSRTNGA
jgi:hypothetical protein